MIKFTPDWLHIGDGLELHWVIADGRQRVSRCGIHANPKRVYSGHSTMKCKRCLKSIQDNGRRG